MSETGFARYQILEKLGEGGMGVVYKARDTRLGRIVALKLLSEAPGRSPDSRRFMREARATSALSHPNILTIHDVDTADGVDYIAMEFVAGETLAQSIPPAGLPIEVVLDYALQITDGLAAAHAAGIVHRDLKPANVMIGADGRVKILDFGLAKMIIPPDTEITQTATVPGVIVGTAAYMSPEQVEGRPVDGRSDIFSLGALLYEMSCGIRAFARDTGIATLAAVLHDEPPTPRNMPPDLATVIGRCLCKNPVDRFQSADELKQSLRQVGRPSAIPAIAVLPFKNMNGEKEDEYFSDGLTEEIINALTKIAGLRVTARTSAFAFREREQDIREIGARLGVDNILEGSVRRAGSRVRVTAQLIKVSDGYHAWSERYEREITDVFAIQDEISQAIANKLQVGIRQEQRAARRPTGNMEAYNLYLKGRYHLSKWTPEGFARARQFLEQAIALDSEFALAYDTLSEYYWYLGFFGLVPPREAFSTGIWAALRAVEIEDALAETHALIGMYRKELDYNWPEVEREMKRAMDLNPSPVVRLRNSLSGLMPLGRLEEAVQELKIVIESDPLSLFNRWWLTVMYYLERDYVRAMDQARFMVEIDASYYIGHWARGLVSMEQGLHAEAVAEFREAAKLSGELPLIMGWLGMALARSGKSEEARALQQQLSAASRAKYVPPTCFAWIHLELGEVDDAFTWMDRAIEARDPIMIPIKTYPFLDRFRTDPRYHALLRKMNLEK